MKTAAEVLAENGYFADLTDQSKENFLRACKEGPTEVVRAFLDLGMDVNARVDISQETALIKAAEGGSIERLELLLERGADLTLIDSSQDTAFRTALNWSHPEAARYLAGRGSDLTAANRYGESALLHTIEKSQPSNTELLLELGADVNFVGRYSRSAPRKAIENGDESLFRSLIEHKLDLELKMDPQGNRPLHYAITKGATGIARMLLEAGADLHGANNDGTTAYEWLMIRGEWMAESLEVRADEGERARAEKKRAVWSAASDGDFTAAIAALAEAGLDANACDCEGKSLLVFAVEKNSLDGVRALLDAGAIADHRNAWGNGALQWVRDETEAPIIELLVERGARPNDGEGRPGYLHTVVWNERVELIRLLLKNAPTFDALQWAELINAAVMKKNVEVVRALHEGGCPLDVHAEIGGEGPLHGACSAYRSDEVIQYLLEHGADPHLRNHSAYTPLHSAVQHYAYDDSYIEVLRLLIAHGARWDVVDDYTRTPWECARDLSKQHVTKLVVEEPIESGRSLDELAASQNWATLAIWYDAGRRDEVFSFVSRGVNFEPPADIKATPLLSTAIQRSDLELVRALIERGANVRRVEHYGTTMMHHAAETGSVELCELLLANGADATARDDWGSTAVHTAAKHPAVLRMLLDRGFDGTSGLVSTPLMTAVGAEQIESVQLLLARGASPNAADSYHGHTIFVAIEKGNVEIVRMLLDAGARTDVLAKQSGDTPLTAAAKTGNVEMVRMMLEKGADVLAKNRDGEDALAFLAARKELRREFASVLEKHGVDTSPPVIERLPDELVSPSPWFAAVYSGDLRKLRAMLAEGHAVDDRDPYGATALMYAVEAERYDLVQALLDASADPKAKDSEGNSVSGYASFSPNAEIDALLEERAGEKLLSMDVLNERAGRSMLSGDARKMLERGELKKLTSMLREKKLRPFTTIGGRSLVNLAISIGDSDLLDFLLGLGLTVSFADLRGQLPLLAAVQSGETETAEMLLSKGASLDVTVNGQSLLLKMISEYNESAAQWLLERGASADGVDEQGRNALQIAVQNGQSELGLALVKRFPSMISQKDNDGMTALHRAAENWWGASAIAREIVEQGVDLNAFDVQGRTALHIAVECYADDAARFFLSRGASWDFVAPGVEDARSARQLAEDFGMEEGWPGEAPADEPTDDGSSDEQGALDDDE
ncbi:MAG: ankyrin repeat domain-containing protein [Polyangiales bacterium]